MTLSNTITTLGNSIINLVDSKVVNQPITTLTSGTISLSNKQVIYKTTPTTAITFTFNTSSLSLSKDYKITYEETDTQIKEILEDITEEIEKEAEKNRKKAILQSSLTKREVFLALYKAKGVKPEQIRDQITNEEELIEFDYAERYYRGNPLINSIGVKLGFSSDDIDYLFLNGELPT